MAEISPLRALRYDLARVGGLERVIAPPYDVIDDKQCAELAARSPHNVVAIDLPRDPEGGDDYEHAAALVERWMREGALVRDGEPAIWALEQSYSGPDGAARTRNGFLARLRIEEYGAGRVRPHERTHPGPREDRLRLTRATRANLSPIFALYSDPRGEAWDALQAARPQRPWGEATDDSGTTNRLWLVTDTDVIDAVAAALADRELLIADGHHRYETARAYAGEVGGRGGHEHVLVYLVAIEDPGLLVFPTHRLIGGIGGDPERQAALREAIERDFEVAELPDASRLEPPAGEGPLTLGYMDGHHRTPYRLTLRDQAIADAALAGHAEPYRRLDTAVLEALLLKGALGLGDEDISQLRGLGYARSFAEARAKVDSGEYHAGFFMRPTPVAQVREVAAAGESMPPKSTFFHPKVPTGLLFNPLD